VDRGRRRVKLKLRVAFSVVHRNTPRFALLLTSEPLAACVCLDEGVKVRPYGT
jgi:hypothetical protein